MTNLTSAEITTITQKLNDQLQRLSTTERRLEDEALQGLQPDSIGEVSHMPQHHADVGDLAASRNVDLSLASAELREINGIRKAIGKIRSGNYGVCERCGTEIPRDRLMAVPAAPYCMACERAMERRQNLRKKPNDTSPYLRPLEDEQEIPY